MERRWGKLEKNKIICRRNKLQKSVYDLEIEHAHKIAVVQTH